ncbi:MAG TPA: TIGR00282 family metallophosphoesterase [Elusimicrobia bacterium]|nr:MAG: metallophosphoesterase [Elusimicrobia bacterium RIFOXYA12_FULL_49_49]OGS08834.1 MAG: metallophosphoesterase [Elusimicrobia bacterium RIFOXYA1_FULL_47_7]OGS11000.1 MAG: metallophosphoesterase [Elusimicrobia bacterium RIFOXYB1_FULL_48_9]OGS15163.1 MAG: metallophosphoesterase [Elusimicrobia bacterium RIFOXYA2_FULL_47_53]OGS29783.1 MAG: metallophosphoesterase [Elusimicrobia bacterium RIFOXYB2_FULL_46_23]HBU70266.1 TIGR00282 family metallophosphoesterase [Elusimicrobiota bacterium]
MKIVFISDIVGEAGREILSDKLPGLIAAEKPDFVVANAENAAGGKGLTSPVARELFSLGIGCLTLGNHSFDRKEIENIIDDPRILRPANYPDIVPGQGHGIYEAKNGKMVGVINLMGRVYLPATDCPFRKAAALAEKIREQAKVILVDIHAEVTSEKQAMGWYLDGSVSAVIGTHTHIPTADERIMPQGTAYITDAGMTGPYEGVIGMDREVVLKKFLTGIPQHFVIAKGASVMQGCVIEADDAGGKASSIKRFSLASNN